MKEIVQWTSEEKQAINEKNANILVAGAARKRKNSSFRGENIK